MPSPYRVLFVCLGNICRSPMAEVVFRSMIDEAGLSNEVTVASAATGDWHVGEQAHLGTLEVLRGNGFDGTAHRAQKFRRQCYDDFDLIIAMDRMNLKALHQLARTPEDVDKVQLLRSFDTDNYGDVDVPDPYGASIRAFEEVYAVVTASCRGLLDYVRTTIAA